MLLDLQVDAVQGGEGAELLADALELQEHRHGTAPAAQRRGSDFAL
jgi:hypothetical protein